MAQMPVNIPYMEHMGYDYFPQFFPFNKSFQEDEEVDEGLLAVSSSDLTVLTRGIGWDYPLVMKRSDGKWPGKKMM